MSTNAPDLVQAPTRSKPLVALITVILAINSLLMFYVIIKIWPTNGNLAETVFLFGRDVLLTPERRYMLMMPLGGALGASIHLIISFTAFVGNRAFVITWIPWYALRPFVGAGLALFFYLLLRGGILTYSPTVTLPDTIVAQGPPVTKPPVADARAGGNGSGVHGGSTPADVAGTHAHDGEGGGIHNGVAVTADTIAGNGGPRGGRQQTATTPAVVVNKPAVNTTTDSLRADSTKKADAAAATKRQSYPPIPLNPYGMMAIACMVGMFSKEAARKLEETFKTVFNVREEDKVKYADKLPNDPDSGDDATPAAGTDSDTDDDINDVLPDAGATDTSNDSTPQG